MSQHIKVEFLLDGKTDYIAEAIRPTEEQIAQLVIPARAKKRGNIVKLGASKSSYDTSSNVIKIPKGVVTSEGHKEIAKVRIVQLE